MNNYSKYKKGKKVRKENITKKQLLVGEGICSPRSACLSAEAALGSVGMEEKGIPSAAHAVRVTGRYQQGTSLHLSYIHRLNVTGQPGRNALKEKESATF